MVILIIYFVGAVFINLLINTFDGCYLPDERAQRNISWTIALFWPVLLLAGLAFTLLCGLINAGRKICRMGGGK